MKLVMSRVMANEVVLGAFNRPGARGVRESRLVRLSCPGTFTEARPGQFVMVRCGEECLLPRPFSIHQVDSDGIAIYYKVWEDGVGTDWLSRRRVGDEVALLDSPLGNGFAILPGAGNLLLVAGGDGIAPLIFLAQKALEGGRGVALLYGTASSDRYEKKLPLPRGLELVSATEDGSVGHRGPVTDLILGYIDRADQVFACGPAAMYRDMALRKQEIGLAGKPLQVSLEVRMGCGRGLCYGCTIKTRRGPEKVCQDGPVFSFDDILWEEVVL